MDHVLDQYLKGKLTAEEVKLIHEQLQRKHNTSAADSTNLADVEGVVLPMDLLGKSQLPDGKAETVIQTIRTSNLPQTTIAPIYRQRFYWAWLAAPVALLLFLWIGLIFMPEVHHTEDVYEAHFREYTPSFFYDKPATQEIWQAAQFHYKRREYGVSTLLLQELAAIAPQEASAPLFLVGMAALQQWQANIAIEYLLPMAQENGILQEQALWYLALAYLQNNNPRTAKAVLTEIVERGEGCYKFEEAVALLRELNNNH